MSQQHLKVPFIKAEEETAIIPRPEYKTGADEGSAGRKGNATFAKIALFSRSEMTKKLTSVLKRHLRPIRLPDVLESSIETFSIS